jgi:pimeloyl-ACP methyl ester carboxylesterase
MAVRPAALALAMVLAVPAAGAELPAGLPLPGAPPRPSASGFVEVAGARLRYAAWGRGRAVVLLHGGAGNGDHWALQVVPLAKGHRVIALDARGHGRSSLGTEPIGYHRLAEDVVAVLDRLKVPRASVVGWSDGAIVGLDLAIHHPERVDRLVLLGANFDHTGSLPGAGTGERFDAYLERCAADQLRFTRDPGSFDALLEALRPMWRSEPAFTPEELGRVRAPTLVLHGEGEENIPEEHARALARLVPGARLAIVPGASHFALWQRPERFNALVLGFLAERPRRRR